MTDTPAAERRGGMGKIGAPHGVQGWVRIFSTAEPPASLFDYPNWQLNLRGQWSLWTVNAWKTAGNAFVAQLCAEDGHVPADRDQAARLVNHEIAIHRDELPELAPDEYYWADLIGLEVVTEAGVPLGRIVSLFATGANDVMVVRDAAQELLLPFVQGPVVKSVDLQARRMVVAWDTDF